METYIGESLALGLIVPSSSPVGAKFFVIKKKDKTFWPSSYYQGPKGVTVRNKDCQD